MGQSGLPNPARGMNMIAYGSDILMGIAAIVFIVVAVLAVIALLKYLLKDSKQDSGKDAAGDTADRSLSILNERFAKGEITKEEFLAIREDLKKQ